MSSFDDKAIDRATWKRLSSDREGCNHSGCTHTPIVSVTVTAAELTGERGGNTSLAKRTYRYCAPHAESHFIKATEVLK